jgi:hypothetical protein
VICVSACSLCEFRGRADPRQKCRGAFLQGHSYRAGSRTTDPHVSISSQRPRQRCNAREAKACLDSFSSGCWLSGLHTAGESCLLGLGSVRS